MNNNIKKFCTNRHTVAVLMILSIILIAVWTYRDILNYFFRADEEIACIYAGRFQSVRDIINIFTKTHLEGAGWPPKLYRPLVDLSCGANYLIWGLNPVAYYLTNLVIHILVSISVFFLARLLIGDSFRTGGKYFVAWLSAILFTIHPINLDIISCVTIMRVDSMSTLFSILSLLLFIKCHPATFSQKIFLLLSSIFFYILAFYSKEIAIILPFLIFTYLVIFSDEVSSKVRIVHAIKKTAPYFIVTFVLIAWRAYILKSSEGISGNYSIWNIIFNYFYSLIDPNNFLLLLTSPKRKIFVLLMLIVFGFLLVYKEVISKGKLLLIEKRNHLFPISYKGKLITFLLVWLSLPLSIYCVWMILPLPWRMYPPLVPFSILISFLFIESLKTIKGSARLLLFKRISISIIIGILILFLLYTSPLRKFHERNPDIKSASMFLDKLKEVVPKLPDGANVRIYNVPENIFPFVVLKLWLNLIYPENKVKTIFSHTIPPVKPLPDYIDFEIETIGNNDIRINVILKTKEGKIIQ